MQEIYTRDWAQELVKLLSHAASADTQLEVLSIFNAVANQLDDFLGNFNRIRMQIDNLNMKKTIVKKYRRQITSANISEVLQNYNDSIDNAQEIALYTALLNQMTLGYYLLNKVRDTLFEPLTYAIGFMDENNELVYVDGVEIEELLQGTLSLSTRIRMSEKNFARLEIDLKEVIQNLREQGKIKQAKDDPLYNQIQAYTSVNKHTYYSNTSNKYKSKPFSGGYLWETYRYMKLTQTPFSEGALHAIYEEVRKGNLIYTKGGDVLSEQDKYGKSVALTSMATIVEQMPLLIAALRAGSAQDVASALQEIFIQKLTDKADKHLQQYVEKDTDKLLSILKLK